MMIIYILLLECLFTTTIVNSLPQITDFSDNLYLDNPGEKLALTSDNPTDVAQASDTDSPLILSG